MVFQIKFKRTLPLCARQKYDTGSLDVAFIIVKCKPASSHLHPHGHKCHRKKFKIISQSHNYPVLIIRSQKQTRLSTDPCYLSDILGLYRSESATVSLFKARMKPLSLLYIFSKYIHWIRHKSTKTLYPWGFFAFSCLFFSLGKFFFRKDNCLTSNPRISNDNISIT